MKNTIPNALRTAFKYASHIPTQSESSSSNMSHFEIMVRIPGELPTIILLDNVHTDLNDLTEISRKVTTSKGKCNEMTAAGGNKPDSQTIRIGKGHVALKRGSMSPSSIVLYTEALVKILFCDLTISFRTASLETLKSKFLAHLVEPVKS
ncbi:unnamed protein product [Adineta ricciae]|uniref:Uncharacterized protein n=1 Tax=Adineta ricciae TaxID=249248 RepID=A0A816F4G3_ADIRI|nr:unnamed protein product [Adineta ricciae]